MIKTLCEKAESQGKKTVPTKYIRDILEKGNFKMPDKLPEDMKTKEVIKYVDKGGKSKACVLM